MTASVAVATAVALQSSALHLEAEDAQLSGMFRVADDHRASGGAYVSVERAHESSEEFDPDDAALFCFQVEEAAEYAISADALGPDGDANSFFVRVDYFDPWVWDVPVSQTFTNEPVTATGVGDLAAIFLEQGQHVVGFHLRESGTELDAIQISTEDGVKAPTACEEAGSGTTRRESEPSTTAASSPDTSDGGAHHHAGNSAPVTTASVGTTESTDSAKSLTAAERRRNKRRHHHESPSTTTSTTSVPTTTTVPMDPGHGLLEGEGFEFMISCADQFTEVECDPLSVLDYWGHGMPFIYPEATPGMHQHAWWVAGDREGYRCAYAFMYDQNPNPFGNTFDPPRPGHFVARVTVVLPDESQSYAKLNDENMDEGQRYYDGSLANEGAEVASENCQALSLDPNFDYETYVPHGEDDIFLGLLADNPVTSQVGDYVIGDMRDFTTPDGHFEWVGFTDYHPAGSTSRATIVRIDDGFVTAVLYYDTLADGLMSVEVNGQHIDG